ncbi:MAG: hypothetical protein CL820_14650 [Croceicoccus sp.]|nr:hypothetical protein [Croceicoccus sp.]MAL27096.1 hypothetical protein [Croceicoccus sp.]|tara:strand:- start:16989 stop:18134 length:1146 start_codon:yes stop_codon:yes gene_type:complete
MPQPDTRPVGIFVHHQGRGHAERCAHLANAVVEWRPVTMFCTRDDIFPPLNPGIEIRTIPSLFEAQGSEAPRLAGMPVPDTLHCAPLGWHGITEAVAEITGWFASARPALFVTDVSAEIGQLCRIASVPHVAVLQHGDRDDPAHRASYDGAVGLLAPYDARLEQPGRPDHLLSKIFHAPGLGIAPLQTSDGARERIRAPRDRELMLVIAGGGGQGTPTAPLTLGARAEPDTHWIVIGETFSEWHETPPGNLELRGWVDNASDHIAAADRIVSSCGNTIVHQIIQTGKPWIAIPEWRYFAEQERKAEALARAGVCASRPTWPSDAASWATLWDEARAARTGDAEPWIDSQADRKAARWLDDLARDLWEGAGSPVPLEKEAMP